MNTSDTNQHLNILDESILSRPQGTNPSELVLIGILGYFSLSSTLWTKADKRIFILDNRSSYFKPSNSNIT